MFADFDRGFGWPSLRRSIFDIEPFWRGETVWSGAPAVDIVEKDGAFEVRAEVPGMEEKDVEVALAGGMLTIKSA